MFKSLTLAAVPATVCNKPDCASTPMWAFMPKYHGLPGQAARADHQTLFVGDRQADFDAELVGVASLAFRDAFHLRRVQRVELVLAGALLSSDALGAFQPHGQIAQGLRYRSGQPISLDVASKTQCESVHPDRRTLSVRQRTKPLQSFALSIIRDSFLDSRSCTPRMRWPALSRWRMQVPVGAH